MTHSELMKLFGEAAKANIEAIGDMYNALNRLAEILKGLKQ
jgi:hypothetical protein